MERDVLRSAWQEEKHDLRDVRPPGRLIHPVAVGEAVHESMGKGSCAFETLRRYERTIQRDLADCLRQLQRLQESRSRRAELAGPAQAPVEEEARCHEVGFVSQAKESQIPAAPKSVGFVSQKRPGATVGFVSQKRQGATVGSVSQKRQAVDDALAEFVSQALAAGK